jgi:hypothetical protein
LEIHNLKFITPNLMIPVPMILFYCLDYYYVFFGVMLILLYYVCIVLMREDKQATEDPSW